MVKPNITTKSLKLEKSETIKSPGKVISLDRLNSLYLNKPIKFCLEAFTNVEKINDLITIFEQENKVGLASLRSIFKDFNPIFQSEQSAFLEIPKALFPQATPNICLNTKTRRRPYHTEWINMCFYCGTQIQKGQETQCDHVIDILNTYVSLKPNENFYRNFERVHKQCNNKASNNNLTDIWNSIGNPQFFPPPIPANYCVTTLLPSISLTPENFILYNSAICRYYLFENILQYLQPWSIEVYTQRKDSIQKIYSEYKTFLQTAQLNLNISPQISAAHILREMPLKLHVKKSVKFKKDIESKKKTLKKKKSLSPSDSESSPMQDSTKYLY